MLRAVDDPAGTRRVAIVLTDDAYDVLNRARIAAAATAGTAPDRMSDFVGALVDAVAQGLDPVEIERRILAGDQAAGLRRVDVSGLDGGAA